MGRRRGPDRVYPQALKLAAVERMEAATNITALSRELGIQRELGEAFDQGIHTAASVSHTRTISQAAVMKNGLSAPLPSM